MGNNCATEPGVRASFRDNKASPQLGCFGCQGNSYFSHTIDHNELQTHNNSLIPRGKISINSIEFLKKEEISFLRACAGKNVSAIRFYMKKGVNVNLLDEDRTSPLHVAARSGSLQVVEELVNYGASINMADMAGWTPLHIASYYRRALIAHLLLKKGANPYNMNRNGDTPWDLVSDKGTEEIFFIHFDRAELRKMMNPKKDRNVNEEYWAMSEQRPQGSFIDPDFKRSIKEDDSNPFLRGVQVIDIIKKNVEHQGSSSTISHSSKRTEAEHHYEDSTGVRSSQALKEKKSSGNYNIELPKKHKYFLYFKTMKNSQVKLIRDANLLYTLKSEEDDENSLHVTNSPHASQDYGPHKSEALDLHRIYEPSNVVTSQNLQPLNPHFSEAGRNIHIPINSLAGSQNNSVAFFTNMNMVSMTNPNGTFTKEANMTHNRSMYILPTVTIEKLVFGLSENSGKFGSEPELAIDSNLFKCEARFKEAVYKFGVELFNYDGIFGLGFLMLFRLLKKNTKEVAYFLFKEESSMTLKKSPIEVTKLLTDQNIRECQEILKWYAYQFAYDTKDFFDCLKSYLTDFILDFDPEKIDWILRGFAIHYYQKSRNALKPVNTNGKREEFESVEAIRMLAFATVMLNHEIHYEEGTTIEDKEKIESLRIEFHANLSGINDGENFSKAFINKLFDQVRKEKVMRVSQTDPLQEKNQKLCFRTAKLTIRVLKQSKKNKNQIYDYYMYITGPVCLIAKVVDGSPVPKATFSLLHCKLRNLKGVNIEFSPASASTGGIPVARFRHKCIQVFTRPNYSFNLLNNEDLTKLEKHITSLQ